MLWVQIPLMTRCTLCDVIKIVSDLRQVGGFRRVLRFPPPINLTSTIQCKYCVITLKHLTSLTSTPLFPTQNQRHNKNLSVLGKHNFCYVWWACFSTDSRHSYGYYLCSPSRWPVPLFVQGKLQTGASQEKRKKLAQSFNFTLYRWCPFTK